MSEIKINGAVNHGQLPAKPEGKGKDAGGFEAVLKDALGKVTEIHNEAEKAIKELASGGDITQAILAMEKADMSFQVMVEVRNKLINAYQEIMRMQV
jgi:flagellar hook-basal body complex protein FliE